MAAKIPTGMELVGPFPASTRPQRGGLYLRVDSKGRKQWAWFSPGGGWGTYSGVRQRAIQKYNDGARSHKSLDWFGTTAACTDHPHAKEAAPARTFRGGPKRPAPARRWPFA